MPKNEIPTLEEFLTEDPVCRLFITEAVHRYVFKYCFGDDGRLKSDPATKELWDVMQSLHCHNPDWRYKIRQHMERYSANESTNALDISGKPKKDGYFTLLGVVYGHINKTPWQVSTSI